MNGVYEMLDVSASSPKEELQNESKDRQNAENNDWELSYEVPVH